MLRFQLPDIFKIIIDLKFTEICWVQVKFYLKNEKTRKMTNVSRWKTADLICAELKKKKLILDNARQPMLPQLPVYLTLAYPRLRISTIVNSGYSRLARTPQGGPRFFYDSPRRLMSPECNASYIYCQYPPLGRWAFGTIIPGYFLKMLAVGSCRVSGVV